MGKKSGYDAETKAKVDKALKSISKKDIEAYKKKHPNAGKYDTSWEHEDAKKKAKGKPKKYAKGGKVRGAGKCVKGVRPAKRY